MKELAYLNTYLIRYKYHLVSGILLVFLNNIFATLVAPLARESFNLVGKFIENYKNTSIPLQKETILKAFSQELMIYCLQIIGTSIVAGIFLYFQRKTIIGVSRKIEFDLKNEIYRQYQTLPLSFYKKNNTGDLMNRISEDVSQVRNYLGPCIMYGLNLVAIFAVTIPFMLSVSTTLTFYTLLPLPLLALSIYLVNTKITKLSEAIQRTQSDISTHVQEAFSGIRILKSFVREKDSVNSFQTKSALYKDNSIRLSKVQALFFPMILTLIGASNILVVYIGGIEVIHGHIDYGNIAEFFIYLNRMSWPVASLGWISSLIQRAEVSQGRINEFLKVPSEIISGSVEITNNQRALEFKNVCFHYPDTGIEALKNCSFTIEDGQTIAIVGNTGSGKSSIANLLCRMYDPSSGEILLNGKPLSEYSLSSYRNTIGYVPQDVFLFSDTIRNNIAFGSTKAEEPQLVQAAKDADLYTTVSNFPLGFDTILGERGITLSGGQKQRVSIARALVKNPSLLILDDSLSAVDTETENSILMNLQKIMHRKTSVIISHRVSSVKLADKILVLSHGEIIEQGSHDSLMALNGAYKDIYQSQLQKEQTH